MKKINYIDSIRNPIITEKATILSEQNKTVFKVHESANKKTIKKNIEKLFKVNVTFSDPPIDFCRNQSWTIAIFESFIFIKIFFLI